MSPPVKRRRRLAPRSGISPASRRPRIDISRPMGELRDTLGDGFLDNNGIVLVLFETPTGFAIFGFCGIYLYMPDALQRMWVNFSRYEWVTKIVWLKEFQTFDDKASAINVDTGVNRQLTEMILKWHHPKQTLIVGKEIYQSLNQAWLVEKEILELPKEDRVPMSQGLQMLLRRYGIHIEPEMMFSKDIKLKLLEDADDYKDKLNKEDCLSTYKAMVFAHQSRTKNEGLLASLVKKAKEAHEAKLVEAPEK